jgi:23S rRNA pseudouridine2605 synthase
LGELPDGAVEEVKTRALREQLGERIAALAGADFSGPLVERKEPVERAPIRAPEMRASDSGDRRGREQATRPSKSGGRRGAPDRNPGKSARFSPRDGREGMRPGRDDRKPPHRGGRRPYKGGRDR